MRMCIYNFLVNRQSGIRSRYHKMHDGTVGIHRLISYLYLLWLNFCYYIFFCRFLVKEEAADIYEEKKLLTKKSESESVKICSKADMVAQLSSYDVISFDMFDTLVFRPFSAPDDLFYILGERLGILDFKRIRIEQEYLARLDCFQTKGHKEVTLEGIWNRMEREVGISKEEGMQAECELECQLCFANPYMKYVYEKLLEMGKQIIITSDMYLPEEFLGKLLQKCGYTGYHRLYVSNAYGRNKADGSLYRILREDVKNAKLVHVGDNEYSDVKMAKREGMKAVYYPNINKMSHTYRTFDMSPLIGASYRGIINQKLYAGNNRYSMEYEYGFIYGGLFALGYCNFIHKYCKEHGIDTVVFLSRDGDILKQVYDRLYPNENTVYMYWSRAVAVRLMAEYNRYDYFRRYLYHKCNQKFTIREIFSAMDLAFLAEQYSDAKAYLTDKNVEDVKAFLQEHFEEIIESYAGLKKAAKVYCSQIFADLSKAAVVDIGWAGSGALALSYLLERDWKIPCEITGMVAGTNTFWSTEPEASESFLQSEQLVSYMYSMSHNRDLLKKHNPNQNYNLYWELLLASPKRKLLGMELTEESKVVFRFDEADTKEAGIKEIQKGILAFTEEYQKHFSEIPYMFQISGRDAYAPMLLAASYKERYLKEIYRKFQLNPHI